MRKFKLFDKKGNKVMDYNGAVFSINESYKCVFENTEERKVIHKSNQSIDDLIQHLINIMIDKKWYDESDAEIIKALLEYKKVR